MAMVGDKVIAILDTDDATKVIRLIERMRAAGIEIMEKRNLTRLIGDHKFE